MEMWNTYGQVKGKLAEEMVASETVVDTLRVAGKIFADKIFLEFTPTGEKLKYSEFDSLTSKFANFLLNAGIKKDDRIGLFLRNSPEYLIGMYGSAKAGAVEVPVNFFYKEREVEYILGNSRAKVCFCEDDLLDIVLAIKDKLPELKLIVTKGKGAVSFENVLKESDKDPGVNVSAEDTMAIIYTSGTTGMPKGAVLTHTSYVLSAKAISIWPIEEIESDYTPLPLFHINAQIYSSLGMMIAGRRLILSDRFSPQKFWEEIKKYNATAFNTLGSIMQVIYASSEEVTGWEENPAKFVIVGGTPRELWEKFEDRFQIYILEGYSQTEEPLPFLNHPDPSKRKIGSFGAPAFPDLGHEVKVVDDEGKEVRPGTPGELVRRSPCTMKEYFADEERTKENFINIEGKDFLRSGDIVMVDEDGFAYFVDRKKFIIRRSGENIAAWEVEAVIKDHPAVVDCAVIPVQDPMRGEEIKAIIKLKDKMKEEDIVLYVGKQLAYFKVPRYIEFVDELPYTPTGRVKKAELIEAERKCKEHGWDREEMMPDWKNKLR